MRLFGLRARAGDEQRSWPVLVLLFLVVLAPTVCLLWLIGAATRNERLAIRQKLTEAYEAQLLGVQRELAGYWEREAARLEHGSAEAPCARLFAEQVRTGRVDSLLCDGSGEGAAYPAAAPAPQADPVLKIAAWRRAVGLEASDDNLGAAEAFARIAAEASQPDLAARALLAEARCRVKAGERPQAIALLTESLTRPIYRDATDAQGRSIVGNAQLLALQLAENRTEPTFVETAERLRELLSDYEETTLPAPQRRFLMRELARLEPDAPPLETLGAELLAARYLEANVAAPAEPSTLTATGLPELWQLRPPSSRLTALFEEETLISRLQEIAAERGLPEDTRLEVLAPQQEPDPPTPFLSIAAGDPMPGWSLALHLDERGLFDSAADRQVALYLWTGLLVIAAVVGLAALIARAIARQMRVTRLKNDLLATVTHELKTPLASMRLLVDTLLDGEAHDRQQVRDYLELIAKENSRLSRLVENFLTFSRMERQKQRFDRELTAADDVVRAATEAAGERFKEPDCSFQVDVAPDLPEIDVDPDAMVTVLVNLLDNAYKYTNDHKEVALRAYVDNGHVCFAVEDNGIGISGRALGKVFDRFYQVDRSLSRSGDGCGLGLSIVRFIVDAHDGTVDVTSRLGEGSTFTVRLPSAEDPSTANGETV